MSYFQKSLEIYIFFLHLFSNLLKFFVPVKNCVQISADLEKKWEQKCSTGQRFICTEVTSYKIHILVVLLM